MSSRSPASELCRRRAWNEAAGSLKQGIGKIVGPDKMQAEGAAQKPKGKAQVGVGEVKSTVRDGAKAADKVFDS
jgi:uncharacterized protein YjbJ (UPF0337 family)